MVKVRFRDGVLLQVASKNPALDDGYDQSMIEAGYNYWFQRHSD